MVFCFQTKLIQTANKLEDYFKTHSLLVIIIITFQSFSLDSGFQSSFLPFCLSRQA